ncbi:Uncharacterised protein [uncultured archaeon]|nr:Uncharacterised protein [uncultured archaeon]
MKKNLLIGSSIAAVVLLVLGSLTNVVGYQQVQSSNTKTIKDDIDAKELLLQTICDITNSKKIQSIIHNYEIKRDFENSLLSRLTCAKPLWMHLRTHFSGLLPPVKIITKEYVQYAYVMGVIFSRVIDTSKISLILRNNKIVNQEMQREIAAVIEQDRLLKEEITRLSSSECGCESENTTQWTFPIICTLLFPIFMYALILWALDHTIPLVFIIGDIGKTLNCWWSYLAP